MSWRLRRQLIALFTLVLIIAGIGFLIAPKFYAEPSCVDTRQNQGEVGIDCGGPCAPCELKNPKAITVFWTKAVPVRPNTYDVASEIENPNEVLSSVNVQYEFTLLDNGVPVARKTGSTYIFAQERIHVIEANIETAREPSSVAFRVLNAQWQVRAEDRPNLVVGRKTYHIVDGAGGEQGVIEASIMNRTSFGFKNVEVRVIALDADGNLLGANRIVIDNFASGEERTVKAFWPQKFSGEVATIEVEPRVNLFDPNVIIKPR